MLLVRALPLMRLLLLLLLLAGVLWLCQDTRPAREVAAQARQLWSGVPSLGGLSGKPEPASAAASARRAPAQGLRKCLKGGDVLYTDGACPAGSRELAVTNGAVTVVTMPAPVSPSPSASTPTVLGRLAPPDGVNIKQKQIERAMER